MNKFLKLLFKASLLCSLILFITISSTYASLIEPTEFETSFDETIQDTLEEYKIPNATVSVVEDGQVIFKKGYGYRDIDKEIPVDPQATLFRIGSTSKLFTWTAVMQLVEEGKLDLDTDVNNYIDFVIPSKLEKGSDISEVPPITLRHLMTHTPGFEDVLDGLFRVSQDEMISLDEYLKTYLPARVFPPGEVSAYSNYGTALAGYIVEQVSKVPFEEYIKENIYAPLKMNNSTFYQPLPQSLSSNMANPYRYVEGEYLKGGFEFMPAPAGGMSTTADDMAKFMIAHLDDGSFNTGKILEKVTIDEMHSQQFTHHPKLGGMTLGFIEGTFNNKRTLFHGGGTMMFSTGLYMIPEENIGIFISYSGGGHLIHTEIFQEFMDKYYPISLDLDETQSVNSTNSSKEFIGQYPTNRRSFTTSNSLISLMQSIEIDVDDEGYLLATYLGETNRFIEIEPGVYKTLREGRTPDYFGPFSTLVFSEDPFGRVMLASDGPMTYSKAPWYATTTFTLLSLIIVLLILILSSLYWVIAFIISLFKDRKNQKSKLSVAFRVFAIAFVIVTLGLLLSFLGSAEMDPIYQLPKDAFNDVASSSMMDLVPLIMTALALLLVIFTGFIWVKKHWKILPRIHYTIFTSAALFLLWIFNYWNII